MHYGECVKDIITLIYTYSYMYGIHYIIAPQLRDQSFPIALLEERLKQYAELLRGTINDTLVYLQNKQVGISMYISYDLYLSTVLITGCIVQH